MVASKAYQGNRKKSLTLDQDHIILFQDSEVQKSDMDRLSGESSVPKRTLVPASNKGLTGNDLNCDCTERVNSCNLKGLQPISLYYM